MAKEPYQVVNFKLKLLYTSIIDLFSSLKGLTKLVADDLKCLLHSVSHYNHIVIPVGRYRLADNLHYEVDRNSSLAEIQQVQRTERRATVIRRVIRESDIWCQLTPVALILVDDFCKDGVDSAMYSFYRTVT